MKITVVTPTIRKDSLELNRKCLERQTLTDYEWLIVSPYEHPYATWIPEPPKKEGTYYNLNAAWNEAFRHATGNLIVSIVDLLWFSPDTLERLWQHYERDPLACIGAVGHQYDRIENGKPEHHVWTDPRVRSDSTFYKIPPYDLELCIASIPLKGIKEVGGVDEEYDRAPAWSEKDLACRLAQVGYKCYLDQTIEYRAMYHPRLNEKWDELYPLSTQKFVKDYAMIQKGERLKLNYL